MSDLYKTKKPGDILHLYECIGDVGPGIYVVLSIAERCCLAVLGKHWRIGPCATSTQVYVSLADLSLFAETGLRVEPLG